MKNTENLSLHVMYTAKPGKRAAFFKALNDIDAATLSRAEPGNIRYDYSYPVDSEDQLFLLEIWADDTAFAFHINTDHFKNLQALKEEFVAEVSMEKYYIHQC